MIQIRIHPDTNCFDGSGSDYWFDGSGSDYWFDGSRSDDWFREDEDVIFTERFYNGFKVCFLRLKIEEEKN